MLVRVAVAVMSVNWREVASQQPPCQQEHLHWWRPDSVPVIQTWAHCCSRTTDPTCRNIVSKCFGL